MRPWREVAQLPEKHRGEWTWLDHYVWSCDIDDHHWLLKCRGCGNTTIIDEQGWMICEDKAWARIHLCHDDKQLLLPGVPNRLRVP